MPEQRETAASGKVAKEGIKKALEEDADLTLEGIYADATAAEAKQEEAPERAQSGLVYELNPASTIVRGSESHQTSVYPEVMKYDIENNYPPLPYPPSFKRLVLTGVQTTHRALILNLGMLNLMVRVVSCAIPFLRDIKPIRLPSIPNRGPAAGGKSFISSEFGFESIQTGNNNVDW
ncbi:hypothetical protein R3P38DRAFT_3243082 [Favolaschia claudopus]|uniref:Uncharacterized protein n=1 Tax=Favolaschia claudopus TaxID=2862362 RepID=A0AAV9Z513_9AGAR